MRRILITFFTILLLSVTGQAQGESCSLKKGFFEDKEEFTDRCNQAAIEESNRVINILLKKLEVQKKELELKRAERVKANSSSTGAMMIADAAVKASRETVEETESHIKKIQDYKTLLIKEDVKADPEKLGLTDVFKKYRPGTSDQIE